MFVSNVLSKSNKNVKYVYYIDLVCGLKLSSYLIGVTSKTQRCT